MKPKRERLSDAERREIFNRALLQQQSQGKRLESQAGYHATLISGKPVNHVLHAILSLATAGFWLLVWAVIWYAGGETRELLQVDEYGGVTVTPMRT